MVHFLWTPRNYRLFHAEFLTLINRAAEAGIAFDAEALALVHCAGKTRVTFAAGLCQHQGEHAGNPKVVYTYCVGGRYETT